VVLRVQWVYIPNDRLDTTVLVLREQCQPLCCPPAEHSTLMAKESPTMKAGDDGYLRTSNTTTDKSDLTNL
jgi:hypothetical protein